VYAMVVRFPSGLPFGRQLGPWEMTGVTGAPFSFSTMELVFTLVETPSSAAR